MKTKIWAHRGASGYAPENTLKAFSLAIEQGADGVELDVQLTDDGVPVVIHDEMVDRVTDGSGYVKDYTLEKLKTLCCKNNFSDEPDIRIPTLAEVYELLAPTGLTVNVELKTGIFPYEGIEEKVLLEAEKWNMENRIWYSSFHHKSLVRIKELNPKVKTGILYQDGFIDVPKYARNLGADALHPAGYLLLEEGFVNTCKAQGIPLHVWTVNEEYYIRYMAGIGIDAVITNYPDIGRKAVG